MIRPMRPDDLDTVAEVWLQTNLSAHNFIPPSYWTGLFEPVRDMLARAEIYVYEEKRQILGFIGLRDHHVEGLFIQEDAQSQGIGTRLLRFAKEIRGGLSLHVYEKNVRAIRFYQREGFALQCNGVDEETGERELTMVWPAPPHHPS